MALCVFLVAILCVSCQWFDEEKSLTIIPTIEKPMLSMFNGMEYSYNNDGTLNRVSISPILLDDGEHYNIDIMYNPLRVYEEYSYEDDSYEEHEVSNISNVKQTIEGYISSLTIDYVYDDGEVREKEEIDVEFKYNGDCLTNISLISEATSREESANIDYYWKTEYDIDIYWKSGNITDVTVASSWVEDNGYLHDKGNDYMAFKLLYGNMKNVYYEYTPALMDLFVIGSYTPLTVLAQMNFMGLGTDYLPTTIKYSDYTILTYSYMLNSDGSISMVDALYNGEPYSSYWYVYANDRSRTEYVTKHQRKPKHGPLSKRFSLRK